MSLSENQSLIYTYLAFVFFLMTLYITFEAAA